MEERGTMEIKGKGQIFTYWVHGRDPNYAPKPSSAEKLPILSNNVSPISNREILSDIARPEDQPLLKSNSWVNNDNSIDMSLSALGSNSRPTSPTIAVELENSTSEV